MSKQVLPTKDCIKQLADRKSETVDKNPALAENVLDRLVQELEKIDDCEFAMYSLGLIKEKVEEIKNGL